MRILFVGDDWYGSNASSLADGFAQAGHDVVVVDSTRVSSPRRLSPPWIYKRVKRERAPWDVAAVHDAIDEAARALRPDLLFAFKAINLDQDRLLSVPAGLRVHYSPDDVSNPYNTSAAYLAAESRWDCIVTTKAHNLPELRERGARDALFVMSAYDPAWHHVRARRTHRRFLVGFIGARRPDRQQLMCDLAAAYGDQLYLAGPGWRRVPELLRSKATVEGAKYGEDLSSAIAPVTANLVLLNSDNRDTHTCRTFEVPAAGGLFVGERTDEHAALLVDGAEALLFDSEAELIEHLERCRREPDAVLGIARAGHRRITSGRHTYADRAKEILRHVG